MKELGAIRRLREAAAVSDTAKWYSLKFQGENVYYMIPPYLFMPTGEGETFEVFMALRPEANNVECVIRKAPDVELDLQGVNGTKNLGKANRAAKQVVTEYLNKFGLKQLKKASEEFISHTNAYNANSRAKLSKALKGQKDLPAGYQIILYKGVKVVKGPKGLIPNQGVNDYVTRQDLIDNFYAWQALNTDKSLQ